MSSLVRQKNRVERPTGRRIGRQADLATEEDVEKVGPCQNVLTMGFGDDDTCRGGLLSRMGALSRSIHRAFARDAGGHCDSIGCVPRSYRSAALAAERETALHHGRHIGPRLLELGVGATDAEQDEIMHAAIFYQNRHVHSARAGISREINTSPDQGKPA